jgi:hypothetical protein
MYDESMLFLVDGYNVTRSDPATRELDLESQRDELVARLRARGAQILGSGRIVILFDGAAGVGGSATPPGPVEVVFSRAGSADDAIVRAVQGRSEKVVVVSNDRELLDRVRVHAKGELASLPASACFEAAGRGSSRKGRRPAPPRDVGLPPGANKITQELERLWLEGADDGAGV